MTHRLSILPLRVAYLSLAVALTSCGSDRFVVAQIEQGGSAGQTHTSSGGRSATTVTINGAGGRTDARAESTAAGQRATHPASGGAALAELSLGGTNNVVGVSSATVAGSNSAVGNAGGGLGSTAGGTVQEGQGAGPWINEDGRAGFGGTTGTDTFVFAWAGAGSTGVDASCGCFANSSSQSCFIDVQTEQQTCTIPCTPISDCSDGCPCTDVEVVWDPRSESTNLECVTSDGCETGGLCSILYTLGSPYRLESSACVDGGVVTL